jgi:hypothetical protein
VTVKLSSMGPRDDEREEPAEEEALLAEQDSHSSRPGFNLRVPPMRERYAASKISPWFPLFLITPKDRQLRSRRSGTRLLLLSLCISLSTAALCIMSDAPPSRLSLMVSSGLLSVIGLLAGIVRFQQPEGFWPDWDRPGNPLAHYPTDFTRDILPVPCHSHNDYWRRIPLFEAIHFGCASVEADVWLHNGDLHVGHSPSALTRNRTLRTLYIDPLIEILEHQNPTTEFTTKLGAAKNGVFDVDAGQTLVLMIDVKMDPENTLLMVEDQLSPLRSRGYLSYYDGKDVTKGPITVVASGEATFDLIVKNSTYRDVFLDAPLDAFTGNTTNSKFNQTNSYYASGSLFQIAGFPWLGKYSDGQMEKIKDHIDAAHTAGLQARFWDTPGWPVGLRNYVWQLLIQLGEDVLNVDDVKTATTGVWGKW